MTAHRRAPGPQLDFDIRIIRLIEMASAPRPIDVEQLGRIAYEMFCVGEPTQPVLPNLRRDVFLSFAKAQQLEAIILAALAGRFLSQRAFGDALSAEFGPYLVETRLTDEELILCGMRPNCPFPACIALDGVHAIDLLIEDPSRRIVARTCGDSIELFDALRPCVLRRAPILIDHESARFVHPDFVRYRPVTDRDVEVLQALCPLAGMDAAVSAS